MRIAFAGGFAFSPKGTMQWRAHPLAAELVKLGHELTMFLTPYDNLADSGRKWELDGVRISNLKVGSSQLSYPRLLVSLCRAICEYRPAMVHIFKPKGFAGALGQYLLAKNMETVVVDCDDWEGWGGWNDHKAYPWIVKELIDRQERWMMCRAPAITVASRALNERVHNIRGNRNGVYYVPNGLGCHSASARERVRAFPSAELRRSFNLPPDPIVLYSGRFDSSEESLFFCRAAANVAERHNAALVFVGDGPELPNVKDFFSVRSRPASYFFPRLPYEEFLRIIWTSDIAAFPYPDDAVHRSKCSARIIDYMMMGKPVLTSAVGQNEDYLVDGVSGMLATPGDERDFARKLDLLLQDSELREHLGRNAEDRIQQRFCWSGEPLQQCLAAYQHLGSKR